MRQNRVVNSASNRALIKKWFSLWENPDTLAKRALMSNCVGPCDGAECTGQSAIWNRKGQLLGHLDSTGEGVLMIDTETDEVTKLYH